MDVNHLVAHLQDPENANKVHGCHFRTFQFNQYAMTIAAANAAGCIYTTFKDPLPEYPNHVMVFVQGSRDQLLALARILETVADD